ncbi:ATP-binding protein [Geodermatophilus marinus]|uniref:ATP-binding protein n=1 Tax=Geodermatophilus sp. LHW52908 TaxID=2303986 RepID=UPI001314684E|nr:ATP-binding protein [Geodermatophilus sp. LHW52908]
MALARIADGDTADSLEHGTLDFKTDSARPKDTHADLASAAVCFANASGGFIVLGVADRTPGPAAFVGTKLDAAVVRRQIFELTQPGLDLRVEEAMREGAQLLVLAVPEGLDVHATTKGVYSWRRHDTCVPMRPVDVQRLGEERRGEDWSARADSSGAVDPSALRVARERVARASSTELARTADLPDDDFLRALGAVTTRGRLTRAGALVLGTSGVVQGPRIIYQHKPSMGSEADYVLRLDGSLLVAVERVLEAVDVRTQQRPMHLPDGRQVVLEDVPRLAVREAIMNAVVHGDSRTGEPVHIEHTPEALTVTSPGPLVAGITVDNILTHAHRARFPSLFDLLHKLSLVEQIGAGVDRMFREMLRDGRSAPAIAATDDEVTVTLIGREPDLRVARFVRGLPQRVGEDVSTLLVLSLLLQRRSVSAPDAAAHLQRTPERAQDVLRLLSSDDVALIEPSKGTAHRRHPHYRLRAEVLAALGPAVTYHRPATAEIERKIVEHVAEYEWVNNRTVQNLFDVDVYKASGFLKDLVERGVLAKTSEQSRGIAVRYGPGPTFRRPSRRRR